MTSDDWVAHATREAAAIIAGARSTISIESYGRLVSLVAIGWLQGCTYGAHATLGALDDAFGELRKSL